MRIRAARSRRTDDLTHGRRIDGRLQLLPGPTACVRASDMRVALCCQRTLRAHSAQGACMRSRSVSFWRSMLSMRLHVRVVLTKGLHKRTTCEQIACKTHNIRNQTLAHPCASQMAAQTHAPPPPRRAPRAAAPAALQQGLRRRGRALRVRLAGAALWRRRGAASAHPGAHVALADSPAGGRCCGTAG